MSNVVVLFCVFQVYFFNAVDEKLLLKEVYNVEAGKLHTDNDIGTWTRERGLVLEGTNFWERRKDLQG